jgi:hypothetical protein
VSDPYYFSANLDNNRILCIAPLSNRRIEYSGERLDDVSGYFLFEANRDPEPHSTRILARIVSEEAAIELSEMLNMR